MISKDLLLNRLKSQNLPTSDIAVKVDGVLYRLLSKDKAVINEVEEKIGEIIPERCQLFYISDTTYFPPTQQYSLSFVVR